MKPTEICSDQLKKKYDFLRRLTESLGWISELGLKVMDFTCSAKHSSIKFWCLCWMLTQTLDVSVVTLIFIPKSDDLIICIIFIMKHSISCFCSVSKHALIASCFSRVLVNWCLSVVHCECDLYC